MLDPIALIEAQRLTNELARGARPHSPVRDEPDRPRPGKRWEPIRLRLSHQLRRIADLVEPGSVCGAPTMAERR